MGVRSGVLLSSLLTVAKLLPIALLIVLGLLSVLVLGPPTHTPVLHASVSNIRGLAGYGLQNWLSALLLLIFSYGGYEDALVPSGEVKDPRRTIPFALGLGIAVCALIYTLLQFVIVSTIGAHTTDRPLVDTASALIGRGGSQFVAVAVMLSTYGWISAGFLNAPRLAFSLAEQGDCPHPLWQVASTISYSVRGHIALCCVGHDIGGHRNIPLGIGFGRGFDDDSVWRWVCCSDTPAEDTTGSSGPENTVRIHDRHCRNDLLCGVNCAARKTASPTDWIDSIDRNSELGLGAAACTVARLSSC